MPSNDPPRKPETTGHLLTELRNMIFREMEMRHDAHQKALHTALAAHQQQHADLDQARALAHASLEVRLEGMNEFRATLTQQAQTFISREEILLLRGATANKLDTLNATVRQLEIAHSNLQARLYTVTGLLGTLMALAGILLAVFR